MTGSPHVLMLFLDGVGIGKNDRSVNPFISAEMKTLRSLLGGAVPYRQHCHISNTHLHVTPINATLGVEGLPQSGTGQAALLTGVNAAKVIGKHFGPSLYSTLKPIVEEKNIFKLLSNLGKKVFYANAFPPRYFEFINSQKGRMGAIAYAWRNSGFQLNTHDTLARGEALSADITAEGWNKMGFPNVPELTLQEAGKRLARFSDIYDFVLYEYYFTDDAGHSQSMEKAIVTLQNVDRLLEGIVEHFNFKKNLFLLTSDHGNIEDVSTKSHTRNPVPLLAMGIGHEAVARKVKRLVDVAPAVVRLIGDN